MSNIVQVNFNKRYIEGEKLLAEAKKVIYDNKELAEHYIDIIAHDGLPSQSGLLPEEEIIT